MFWPVNLGFWFADLLGCHPGPARKGNFHFSHAGTNQQDMCLPVIESMRNLWLPLQAVFWLLVTAISCHGELRAAGNVFVRF